LKCRGEQWGRENISLAFEYTIPGIIITRYSCLILKKFGIFSTVSKKTQIASCMKICPVGAELSNVDRQTDITKVTVAFRNFDSSYLKGNIFPLHTMMAYRVIGNTPPLIVNLKTSGEK
jgi:hypothetical protein